VASAFFKDGMIISFEEPCPRIAASDTLAIEAPEGELLEIFPAALRRDGSLAVWYAPHPLLRHWLGWMAPVNDREWSFHMEPYHVDILRGIPALAGT
jgi:hypothetical protein